MSSAAESDRLIEENAARNETLIFNVGGVIFETYRSTLNRMLSGPLTDNEFLQANQRPDKNEYFFDKDPDAFKILLAYLRSGLLSIPKHIDGPNIRNDLVFWGLQPNMEVMVSGDNTWARNGQIAATHAPSQNGTGKMWNILSHPESSIMAMIYTGISYTLMIISVFILVAETTPSLQKDPTVGGDFNTSYNYKYEPVEPEEPQPVLWTIIVAIICCLFFTVEYILRVISSPNKKLFILSFLGIIDFLAILPNWLFIFVDLFVMNASPVLRVFRYFRIFRILRLMRIFKHFKKMFGTDVFVQTLKSCFGQISCLLFLTLILVLFWGTLIYYVDLYHEMSNITNILDGCWWAIITMTTVGYGDIFPETTQGRVLASFCALSGLLLIGLLVSVIVTSMMEISRRIQITRSKTTLK